MNDVVPLSQKNYLEIVDLWQVLDNITPDPHFEIPMREIYQRSADQGIKLSKRRILNYIRDNVQRIDPTESRIILKPTSRGFVLQGARWALPDDEIRLRKVFADGLS